MPNNAKGNNKLCGCRPFVFFFSLICSEITSPNPIAHPKVKHPKGTLIGLWVFPYGPLLGSERTFGNIWGKLWFGVRRGLKVHVYRQFKKREMPKALYIYSYSETPSKLKHSLSEKRKIFIFIIFGTSGNVSIVIC